MTKSVVRFVGTNKDFGKWIYNWRLVLKATH